MRDAYRKWIDENAGKIVERQREIGDTCEVAQTAELLKLLKKAEFTYALGPSGVITSIPGT